MIHQGRPHQTERQRQRKTVRQQRTETKHLFSFLYRFSFISVSTAKTQTHIAGMEVHRAMAEDRPIDEYTLELRSSISSRLLRGTEMRVIKPSYTKCNIMLQQPCIEYNFTLSV